MFLKDCDQALLETKPANMLDENLAKLNKRAMAYIKMAVVDDILVDIKGLDSAYAIWRSLMRMLHLLIKCT